MLRLKDDATVEKKSSQPVSNPQEELKLDDSRNFDEPYVSSSLKVDEMESRVDNNQVVKEEKKSNPLASIAVLLGFVAWIGALFYFSKIEPKLVISTFGAFWLLIAIVSVIGFLKNGIQDLRNIIIAFVFVHLGVELTFMPILQLYVPAFQGENGFRIGMYLVFIFCIVVGALLIAVETYRIIHRREVCTVQVMAQCMKLRDKHFWRDKVNPSETMGYYGRRKAVRGVYQFEYNGNTYEVQDDTNSNVDRLMPGELIKLYINPNNPNEFYRDTKTIHAIVYVIGLSFMLMGIFCCAVF